MVVAAPRLINIGKDARITVIKHVSAQMNTVSDLIHFKALIEGKKNSSLTDTFSNNRQLRLIYGYVTPGTINHVMDINFSANGLEGGISNGYDVWISAAPDILYP